MNNAIDLGYKSELDGCAIDIAIDDLPCDNRTRSPLRPKPQRHTFATRSLRQASRRCPYADLPALEPFQRLFSFEVCCATRLALASQPRNFRQTMTQTVVTPHMKLRGLRSRRQLLDNFSTSSSSASKSPQCSQRARADCVQAGTGNCRDACSLECSFGCSLDCCQLATPVTASHVSIPSTPMIEAASSVWGNERAVKHMVIGKGL